MMSESDIKRRYLIIYRKAMEEAFLENPNTLYDHPILKDLRKSLHLSREDHDAVEKRVKVRLKVNEIDAENYTGRLDYFNKILAKDKQNIDAWIGKGESLYNLGQDERAIQCFDKALKLDEQSEEAWYSKGLAMTELGKLEDAIDAFDRAIQLYPEYKEAWLSSSIALNKRGENKKALACVNKALEIDNKYLPSVVGQLIILLDLQEYDAVVENSNAALKHFPKNEQVIALKREAQRGLGIPEDQIEPEDITYGLPDEAHEKAGIKIGDPVQEGDIAVHDEEVITDAVFEAEVEPEAVMEMVPEGQVEPLQELEVIEESPIYENDIKTVEERQEETAMEIELTPLPEENDVIKLEPIGVTEGAEPEKEQKPAEAPANGGSGPAQAQAGPAAQEEKASGPQTERGTESKEDGAVEELVELKPVELETLHDGETTFEESDKMVEEILEEMEATPEAPAPEAKEAMPVMEAKESLEISDAEPAVDFKESDTVFKSTFDSYEFKVPDREEALIECRNCGDLIPYDSKVCPLCDFELSGGGPAQTPKKAPEPAPRPPEPVQEAPRPPRPPRVKRERPNLVALHEARKKREQAIRFRPKRLFAGIHRINKLIKCPKCGSPVAVPSSVRPILVSCTGCGSFGRLK